MDEDQRVRELLEASLPPETGRAAAKAEVLRRVQRARRRRLVVRATGAIAAAAVVVLGAQVWLDADRTPRAPVIGDDAEDGAVSTACGEFRDEGTPVLWCTTTSQGGGCGRGQNGEAGVSSGSDGVTVDMLVPDHTAVAALTIDGEPVAWQRPRGRTVVFSWAAASQDYTVTAYDASGAVIADYSGDLPPS